MVRLGAHAGPRTPTKTLVISRGNCDRGTTRPPAELAEDSLTRTSVALATATTRPETTFRGRTSPSGTSGMNTGCPTSAGRVRKSLPIVRALGLLAFYDYQACEHPEYQDAEACQFIESIRQEPIRNPPDYGWPEEEEVA